MDIYFPTEPDGFIGVTTTTVFPNAKKGQLCHAAQWVTGIRSDSTSDDQIVRPDGVLGWVHDVSGPSVYVKLDPEYVFGNAAFREDGEWMEMGGTDSTLPGTKVHHVSNTSFEVAGSHQWPRRVSPSGLPFRRWALSTETLPKDALARYPLLDIQHLRLLMAFAKIPSLGSDDDMKALRLRTRYQNPVCENPRCVSPTVPKDTDFTLCTCCKITFYCSSDCLRQHAETHSAWANSLPDSPVPKYNPQGPVCCVADASGRVEKAVRIDSGA